MEMIFDDNINIGRKSVFINLTNHPSSTWGREQICDAENYGEITDLTFPYIPLDISNTELNTLVDEYFTCIKAYYNPVVMLQGEFVFVYRLVNRLKAAGIPVYSACTKRIVSEIKQQDGSIIKTSRFNYGGLREY